MSYLFNYKLKKFEGKYVTCGFPLDSISKIMAKLEEKKINYIILDRRNIYEEEEKYDKNLIIQDFIPGDDSDMRVLTCYSDKNGKVKITFKNV